MFPRRLAACVVGLSCLVGCSVDLSVPPTTEISCDTTDQCPESYVCLVTIQRCVRQDGDISLPHVEDVSIVPALATRGTTVTITMVTDIELASAPEVELAWGGDEPGRRMATPLSSSGTTHVLSYVVGAEEGEGFASLSARLFSVSGVPNTFDLPRAVELDFTAPRLVPSATHLDYVAAPGALRTDLTAVTFGTQVRAFFAVNEPLAPGLVVATSSPEQRLFACDAPLGTFYTCVGSLDATGPAPVQGAYTLVATVTDLAGNTAALELGAFDVDTIAPAAPRNLGTGELVLHRVPHGSAATGGEPRLSLDGAPGVVDPGLLLIAWDRGADLGAVEIARTTAMADGSFAGFTLPGLDRVDVYVQAVDGAGNASVKSQVLEATWTATLGGKEAYDDFVNPHRLLAEPYFSPARELPNSEPPDPTVAALADGAALMTNGGPIFNRGPVRTGHPSVRAGCGLAFDPAAGQGVLFGGWWTTYGGATAITSAETWIWQGYGWDLISPETSPSARGGHAMVFDKARGNTVLFGGCGAEVCTGALGDTWTFDGEEWTRRCWPGCMASECSCTAMPSPRGHASTFYDDTLGEVVLFGGDNGVTSNDETWAWNGTTWRLLAPTSRPSARNLAQVATNPTTGETLLQAGRTATSGTTSLTDTWSWSNGNWTLKKASGGPGFANWTLTFDPAENAFMMLFSPGGQRQQWDGANWNLFTDVTVTSFLSPEAETRPQDGLACSTYDTVRKSLVRFGGCLSANGCRDDFSASDTTWLYRDREFRALDPGQHPRRRAAAGMATLEIGRKVVLYGGQGERSDRDLNGTYHWNGVTWVSNHWATPTVPLSLESESLDGLSDVAMSAIDAGRVVRFGGDAHQGSNVIITWVSTDGLTWDQWGGATGAYPEPTPDGSEPVFQAMAYRPGTGGVFFRNGFGGTMTWSAAWATNHPAWAAQGAGNESGVLWTSRASAANPASQELHGMASCPGMNHVILFGGRAAGVYRDDTWLWNGTWSNPTLGVKPAARGGHTMFCDTARNKVVLFGGTNGSADFNDVWEWDGTAWYEKTPGRTIAARRGAMGAYLPWRGEGVVFGGYGGGYLEDTWIYDGGATSSPAHVFSASFSAAAVGDDAQITRIDASWVAGGVGYNGNVSTTGARLLVWDGGRWRDTSVTNDAVTAAPQLVAWSTATDPEWSAFSDLERPARLQRLFVGVERGLGFAVTPRGFNAQQGVGATIASDYVEVTVSYRLTP